MNPATEQVRRYMRAVTSGQENVGRLERLAVQRHLWDLDNAHDRGLIFDEAKAAAACEMFPVLMVHTKGEWCGKPFHLSDNQAFIVWCLFGWRREDGTRRYRHAYITCARKWGKSEFAAALGLIGTTVDDPLEPGAEVYCAATKEDQARIVFSVAQQMARTSDLLRTLCKVQAKSIVTTADSPQPHSVFKPIGSDSKTSDGFNLHMGILDEIHEWQDRHRGLYEKLTTAHGSRRQPLIVTITTAGDDLSEIWNEMDAFCIQVLERHGEETPPGDNRFVFIARLDEARPCECGGDEACDMCDGKGEIPADDPFDQRNWRKANPNYPVTPKHEFLAEQAADAEMSPALKHAFLRYHCNVKVTAHDIAIPPALWKSAKGELSDWSQASAVCGGWDMGGQDDLAAIGYCARFETGEVDNDGEPIYRYEVDARAYINTENERDLTREPWASWVATDRLKVSSYETLDMREQVIQDHTERQITQWAYDPSNSGDFAQSFVPLGLQPVKFFQNANTWTEPLTKFLSDLKQGRVTHDGNPILEWCATNMVVLNVSRAASVYMIPDKRASKEKIDAIIAVIMAYRFATVAPARAKGKLLVF